MKGMRFGFHYFLLSIAAIGASGFGTTARTSADDPTEYIPATAVVAVIATPEKAILEPALELIPREVLSVLSEDELGFDATKMQKVILIVEKPESIEQPPGFGLVMTFEEAQSISPKLLEGHRESTLKGRPFYELEFDDAPGFLMYDDRTIMWGMRSTLVEMTEANGGSSPLLDLVKKKSTDDHLQAFVDLKTVRPFIEENVGGMLRSAPDPFKDLAKLPYQIESIRLTLNLGEESNLSLVMAANDNSDASDAEKAIMDGIAMGREMLMQQMLAEMDDNPRMRDAMQQYFVRIGDKVVQSLHPKKSGRNLSWKFESDSPTGMTTTAGVLVAMLLPAVQQVREAARRTDSANRIRQFAIAMHTYESAHQRFPAYANFDEDGKPLLSWRVHLLPYMEENSLYEEFRLDEPWDSPHNKKLIKRMPEIFKNPSIDQAEGRTTYMGIMGENAFFDGKKGRRFRDFRDGLSNTAMLVETDASEAVIWTKPGDWEYSESRPLSGLGRIRPAGFNTAFADSSTRMISRTISKKAWKAMITINGGEAIGDR